MRKWSFVLVLFLLAGCSHGPGVALGRAVLIDLPGLFAEDTETPVIHTAEPMRYSHPLNASEAQPN